MNIDKDIERLKEVQQIFEHLKNLGWINNITRETDVDEVIQVISRTIAIIKNNRMAFEKQTENLREVEIERDNAKEELEKYKIAIGKYGGVEQLEKYLLEISQALGNVTICSAKTVIEDKNEAIRCLKSELETYKKIAEWLITKILLNNNDEILSKCSLEPSPFQYILDLARKEVEKDGN